MHPNALQERRRAAAEKARKASIPPSELFKSEHATEKFSQFDQDGVPTHGEDGEPLSASRVKKLKKEMEKHKAFVEAFQKGK